MTVEPDNNYKDSKEYMLGFEDARTQMLEKLIQLEDIKRDYDRVTCKLRDLGIPRTVAKKPSVGLEIMVAGLRKEIHRLTNKGIIDGGEKET